MITTRQLKRKPDGQPQRLGVVLVADVKARPFRLDGTRYAGVKKRATRRLEGHLFTDQLRGIAEAKERAARARSRAAVVAVKAPAVKAKAPAPLRVTPVKAVKPAKRAKR